MILWCIQKESFSGSFLVIFRLGLWLKMRFIAIPMVSWSGILVKRLVKSWETINFLKRLAFLIWETKEKVSLQQKLLGNKGERRSQRKQAKLKLKVPIDETIGWSLGNESLEENLCILEVP